MATEIEEKVTVAEAPEAAAAPAAPRKGEDRRQNRNGKDRRNDRRNNEREEEKDEFEERTISLIRSTKVVKGGKNFSYGALIVVGDKKGHVGLGYGKANEVSDAIRKGGEHARRNLMTVPTNGTTLTHAVEGRFCAAHVIMKPASQGTGVIAGGAMRAILELAGIQDVLAKSLGSSNQSNVVKATFEALHLLRSKAEMIEKRDIKAL